MFFPKNQYNETVTVFTPKYDETTDMYCYSRVLLRNCFWDTDSIAVVRAGGVAAPGSTVLNIPLRFNLGYGKSWDVRIGGELERSIIIRGEMGATDLEEWRGENDMEDKASEFRRVYGRLAREPKDVNPILYGLPSMRRVTVLC